MKKAIVAAAVAILAVAAIAAFLSMQGGGGKAVTVNLQVTVNSNTVALANVIDTMRAYGMRPATVFVGEEAVEQNCSLLRKLDGEGYDIAVFAYNMSQNDTYVQMASLPGTRQFQIINSTKAALQDCLGHNVTGFRSQRFSQDYNTTSIVRELGFKWDASFVTGVDPEASALPYYSDAYGFYVVSIKGVSESGRTYVLCDQAMKSSGKSAQQWRGAVESYFANASRDGVPFVTEFHPEMLTANQAWWDNFTALLSWMEGRNATYMTTQQLISTCAGNSTLACGE